MDIFIKGISYFLPKKIITNEELVKDFPEWTAEKINKKIGIKSRHIALDNETALDLGVSASEKLFHEYNIDRSEIDYLLFVTQSPDYHLPTSACIMQSKLGLSTKIGAFDINLGCSGWVYGLSIAKALIVANMAKNVLLVTAETYSKYIHQKDKGNRTVFGDGSAATLVTADKGFCKIGNFSLGTDGEGASNLIVKTGGARYPSAKNDLNLDDFGNPKSSDFLYMDGSAILNYTLEVLPLIFKDLLEKNNLKKEDINLHIYHQGNGYLSKLQQRKLKIDKEKYYNCYESSGNTVSSTIPIAIYEALKDGTIKKENKVMSLVQGLGYSWGGVVLEF